MVRYIWLFQHTLMYMLPRHGHGHYTPPLVWTCGGCGWVWLMVDEGRSLCKRWILSYLQEIQLSEEIKGWREVVLHSLMLGPSGGCVDTGHGSKSASKKLFCHGFCIASRTLQKQLRWKRRSSSWRATTGNLLGGIHSCCGVAEVLGEWNLWCGEASRASERRRASLWSQEAFDEMRAMPSVKNIPSRVEHLLQASYHINE